MKKALQIIGFIILNTVLCTAVQAQNDNENWNLESSYPGVDGSVLATVSSGDFLYVAGNFTNAGGVSAQSIARYNISEGKWDSLGSGIIGAVNDILLDGNYLYAGGGFSEAGGQAVNNIARFDLENQVWEKLGNGLTGDISNVSDLHKIDTDIFVGGTFNLAGEDSANNIARFDIENETWHPLGSGLNSNVYSMGGLENELIVTGYFSVAGSDSAFKIAKYDIEAENWSSFEEEFIGARLVIMWSVLQIEDNVYIGGEFDSVGTLAAQNVVRYNLTDDSWHTVGRGLDTIVRDFTLVNDQLYAAADARFGSSVFSYNETEDAWSELDAGFNSGLKSISSANGKLYVGGIFSSFLGLSTRIVEYDPQTEEWNALGNGFNTDISAILISEGNVFLGGQFSGVDNTRYNSLVKFNPEDETWSSVGGGATGSVSALEMHEEELYVGGSFNRVGNALISNLAKFNPAQNSWSRVGGGVNGSVTDLLIAGDNLFVAGTFTAAGVGPEQIEASKVARFDMVENTWHSLGDVNNTVTTLEWDESTQTLYIGGNFSAINDEESEAVAAYNLDTEEWTNLNSGMNRGVDALAIHNGYLYAGGRFITLGEEVIPYIVRYNIETEVWESLGEGLNRGVREILSVGNELYVTGSFTASGETTLNGIARYDDENETFYPLGSGLFNGNEVAYGSALAVFEDQLYVGGRFTQAGDKPASMFARYKLDVPVSIEEPVTYSEKPSTFSLNQNYPNPFNPSTVISYQLPVNSEVSLKVFDMLGREVASLIEGKRMSAGMHSLTFDAGNLSSGMYIYRLQAGNQVFTKKLTLIK